MAGSAVEHNWIKYGLAALAIHAAILALPVSEKVHRAAEQRIVDIVVMRREAPPAEAERPKPLPRRPVPREIVARFSRQVPAQQAPKAAEKKEEPHPPGQGTCSTSRLYPRLHLIQEAVKASALPASISLGVR